MPQVTVYVRDEDLSKWKAVQRKSEFLSNALNDVSRPAEKIAAGASTDINYKIAVRAGSENFVIEDVGYVQEYPSTQKEAAKFCKHGAAPQFCKYAKPGKTCKEK